DELLLVVAGVEVMFFFSSRRRHTRCLSDWSSDVCSSDLAYLRRDDSQGYDYTTVLPPAFGFPLPTTMADAEPTIVGTNQDNFTRSEERRVGKECRSRWWPKH